MESDDLKSPPSGDDPLDDWLHAHAAPPTLPDDGFSARVLAALPPSRRSHPSRRRWVIVAGAVAGAAFALFQQAAAAPAGPDLAEAVNHLADPRFPVALFVAAAALALAFSRSVRRLVRL